MPGLTFDCALILRNLNPNELPEIIAHLAAYGLKPETPLAAQAGTEPSEKAAAKSGSTPLLSQEAALIHKSLTYRDLNVRQRRILEFWASNSERSSNIQDLISIFIADGLASTPDEADDYIRGALRSFGRRLKPSSYNPAVDLPPIRRLVNINETNGQRCHQITTDGLAAVTHLLSSSP